MTLNETEFTLFCLEISKVAAKYGISADLANTILAEAIRNREKTIRRPMDSNKSQEASSVIKTSEPTVKKVEIISEPRQVLYAPPVVKYHEATNSRK